MRAALISERRLLEMQDFPYPDAAPPGAVVVDLILTGVCGSDVAAYRDGEQYPPFLSGHEWVGTIASLGEGVVGLSVGDRVVAATPPACGHCDMCTKGHADRCLEFSVLAFGSHPLTPDHGGFAERIVMPSEALVRVHDDLTHEQAAMVEPATVALHAVRRRSPRLGDVAVVIGAGPVGLFAAQLLRIAGAARVVVVEPQARRRELAAELGASAAVTPADAGRVVSELTAGLGADLVFDCVGNERALAAAVELSRPGGVVMMVGVATGSVAVSPLGWVSKELSFDTSLAHHSHEFDICMQLIADGKLRTDVLHDRTIGLDELDDALSALSDGLDELKVLVDPRR